MDIRFAKVYKRNQAARKGPNYCGGGLESLGVTDPMLSKCVLLAFLFVLPLFPQAPAQPQRAAYRPPPIGTFTNGRFHHTLTGTEFTMPLDWTIGFQGLSSGGGEAISFVTRSAGVSDTSAPVEVFVWMKSHDLAAADIPDELRSKIDFKAGQREGMGITGFRMLKNTLQHKTIGGQLALSIEGEFDEANVKMTEYNTWVMSEKTHVYIRARVRTQDFPGFQGRVDQIIDTFVVR